MHPHKSLMSQIFRIYIIINVDVCVCVWVLTANLAEALDCLIDGETYIQYLWF